MKERYDINDLIAMMRALRTPKTGCPWDLEQDFASIAPYTIEEAYEVADAITRGDMTDLREELGDLLLQPIYHAQMAAESGLFDIHDIIHDITDKMISRHPHVFGDEDAKTSQDVDSIWEARKKAERLKKEKTNSHQNHENSALDGVTLGLPALLRAQKLQNKAAKVGFEWPNTNYVYAKIEEEIEECKEAIANGNALYIEEEIGDLLLNVVNLARMNGVNAEESLRKANAKFERRFKGLEAEFKDRNIDLKDASLEQMMQSWCNQKAKEGKNAA